jgi:hypothetical protein
MDETETEAPPLDDDTVSETLGPGDPKGIITGNGAHPLTPELVNLWAPVARKLTLGPLTATALELSDLLGAAGSRTFVEYAVKCALPAGNTMAVNVLGVTHTFVGHVGIAPEWLDGGLSDSSRRWLSACILAHVNATGTPVTILIRGDHPALEVPSGASTGSFVLREGAFYGDIFGLIPEKFACAGAATTPERMCTENVSGVSPCGFVVPGFCRGSSSVCEGLSNGAYETCHSKKLAPSGSTSTAYPETITVYLQP